MGDEDLTTLNENAPDGATEEVAVLDDYARETRRKLKAWSTVEHDQVTGTHKFSAVGSPGAPTSDGNLVYDTNQRELIISNGGFYRSLLQPTFNFLINGMFEQYSVAQNTFPGWRPFDQGTGGLVIHPASAQFYGQSTARIRAGSAPMNLVQYIVHPSFPNAPFGPDIYWRARVFTFGVWVLCSTPNCAKIYLTDEIAPVEATHPGDNQWHWLTATLRMGVSTTVVQVYLSTNVSGINSTFSGATLVEGYSCPHPIPSSWQGHHGVMHVGSKDPLPVNSVPWWYSTTGHSTSFFGATNILMYNTYVRSLVLNAIAPPGACTVIATIDYNNGTLTPLTVSLTGANVNGADNVNGYITSKYAPISVKATRSFGIAEGLFAAYSWEEIPEV